MSDNLTFDTLDTPVEVALRELAAVTERLADQAGVSLDYRTGFRAAIADAHTAVMRARQQLGEAA